MVKEVEKVKELNIQFRELKQILKGFGMPSIEEKRKETIREAISHFNPDVHVIVTKEQLDVTNQLKALTGMASKVNVISEYVDSVKALNVKVKTKRKSKAELSKEERSMARKAVWTQPKKRF